MSVVLEFVNAAPVRDQSNLSPISGVSFVLESGTLMLMLAEDSGRQSVLCDVAEGLIDLESGSVRFLGKDWGNMTPYEQCLERGRIGRVFQGHGMVSNLTLYENVVLASRYHASAKVEALDAAIRDLAGLAGLVHVPEIRPDYTSGAELKKSEWIRAFIGRKDLVLLDRAETGAGEDSVDRLAVLIGQALSRGTAVLWITQNKQAWNTLRIGRTSKYMLRDGKITSAD